MLFIPFPNRRKIGWCEQLFYAKLLQNSCVSESIAFNRFKFFRCICYTWLVVTVKKMKFTETWKVSVIIVLLVFKVKAF